MRTAALLTWVVGGCTVGAVDAPEVSEPVGEYDSFTQGEDCQGRRLLGLTPDGLSPPGQKFVSFGTESSNRPGVFVSVNGADLVAKNSKGTVLYSGKHTSFIGMRLRAPAGGEVEITAVSAQSYGASYALRFPLTGEDYCGGAGYAVPFQGFFEADRFHLHHTNVSFGCDDGVAKKCEGWGYIPGNDPAGGGWRHHQACMRMANADVYGNGEPHTREETPIVIRDMMPGARPDLTDEPLANAPEPLAPPNIPFFEAAWGWKRNEGAICLARPRWASLPVEDPSHPSLLDPRNVDNVAFCEDLTYDEMLARGALVFNASKKMDMFLNRWRNPATGHLIASVRGAVSANPLRVVTPFPGYTEYLGTDGIVLRNLTGTLEPGDVTPLYMQHNPKTGDYVVATRTLVSPDHVIEDLDRDFEGYTLTFTGPELTGLGLFRLGTDYVTSVGGPGTVGYAPLMGLGAVMQPNWAGPPSGSAAARAAGYSPRVTASACQSPQ